MAMGKPGAGPKAIGKPNGPKLGQKGGFGYFFGNASKSCVYAKTGLGNPSQLQPTKGSVNWSINESSPPNS